MSHKPNQSSDHLLCETISTETQTQNETGRFVVRLSFRGPPSTFDNSYSLALRRFLSLEPRLIRSTALYESYCSFMKDYLECPQMEILPILSIHPNALFLAVIPCR